MVHLSVSLHAHTVRRAQARRLTSSRAAPRRSGLTAGLVYSIPHTRHSVTACQHTHGETQAHVSQGK